MASPLYVSVETYTASCNVCDLGNLQHPESFGNYGDERWRAVTGGDGAGSTNIGGAFNHILLFVVTFWVAMATVLG